MRHDEAIERIEEIQRIAERYTLYTLLPGIPAVIGGTLVLVGCIISYVLIRSLDFAWLIRFPVSRQILFLVMWCVIGILGIAQEVILTSREAKKMGITLLGRPGRLAAYSLTPCILIALIITIRILMDAGNESSMQMVSYIAPVWMMCYGVGVYSAGLFSLRLPRMLGLAFLVMGIAGLLFFPTYGLILIALSFGMLHIIFGLIVIGNARRSK